MKRTWLTLALLGASLLAPYSRADDVALTAIMRTHRMSAMNAAAVLVIADALNLDADFIISTGRGSGVSPIFYGPAYIYAYRTDRPFMEVWRTRNMGWGEIAHSIGMHPGTFNKLRKRGYTVNQIIWMDALYDGYRIPYGDYGTWRSRGYPDGRIFEMVVRTDGSRTKLNTAFSWKGKPTPASKIKPGGKGKSGGPPGLAKGKGSGKGSGKAVGKGSGKSSGHGMHKGPGKGTGKTKGGPGKGKGGPGKGRGGPGH